MFSNKKIFQIAWDCDGVLAESHGPVLKAANKKLSQILGKKIELTKSNLNTFDALSEKTYELTKSEKISTEIKEFWHTPEILRISPPNPATIEVFKRCQSLPNTSQCVITTRRFQNRQITREWLEQYLPSINWQQNLFIRQESDSMNGEEFKIIHLKKINCMIEDNTVTVTNINRDRPKCNVIYINQPWNKLDQDKYRSQFRLDFDDSEGIFKKILAIREKYFSYCS
ncbi:MAG: hypothetical protein WC503_05725 [Candidatus Shapirobacteria bacterium]